MQLGRLQRGCQRHRTKVDSKEKMPAASDNGSQPYRKAFRFFEMAGKRHHTTYILADMQGTRVEHVAYHKGRLILGGVTPYQPFRNTQGRFCMAGYHCLMPNGISFVATQHKSNGLTAFIPLRKHQQSNAYSISSSKTRI